MKISKYVVAVSLSLAAVASVPAQTLKFDQRVIEYGRQQPFTRSGVVFVPLDLTIERVGINVRRERDTYFMSFAIDKLEYKKGERIYRLNGRTESLPAESREVSGRTYVPVQLISDLTRRRFRVDERAGWGGNRGDSWNEPRLSYRGRTLTFDNNERPYRSQGTTMVPFSATADKMGGRTGRVDSRRIYIEVHGRRVEYEKGRWYEINGRRKSISARAEERNSVLFVPIELYTDISRGELSTGNSPSGWTDDSNWGRPDSSNSGWDRPEVNYRGRALSFNSNERPYRSQGTVMVPFAAMADKLGGQTGRVDSRRIYISVDGRRIEYEKGRWYEINGRRKSISAHAEERNSVLFVPIELYTDISRNAVSTSR